MTSRTVQLAGWNFGKQHGRGTEVFEPMFGFQGERLGKTRESLRIFLFQYNHLLPYLIIYPRRLVQRFKVLHTDIIMMLKNKAKFVFFSYKRSVLFEDAKIALVLVIL